MLRPADTRRSWDEVLNRTLFMGAALWITGQLTFTLLAFSSAESPQVGLAMGTATAAQVVLAGLCLRGTRGPLGPSLLGLGIVTGALGVVAGSALVWLPNDLPRALQLMAPTTGMQSLELFVIAMVPRVRWTLVTIAACGAAFLALNSPVGITWEAVEQWSGPASATLALALMLAHLRDGSAYAVELAELNRRTQQQALAATAEEAARAEARRVIHDDVIAALWAVEHGLPRAECTAAAAEALTALSKHREVVTRAELIAALTTESVVKVDVVDEGWPVEPPSRVLEAFRVAAAEALRNVARHSGVDRATIRLSASGSAPILQIVDGGRGVANGAHGFGTSESMAGRMASVGGTAAVAPGAQSGTVVTLTWSVPVTRLDQLPYLGVQPLRGYLPPACIIAANSSFLAWRHPGPHPAANLTLAAFLAMLLPLTAWWFATHPARWRDLPLVALVSSGLLGLGIWLSGDGALLDFRGWVVGMTSALVMLFAFGAPVGATSVAAVALEAVVLWSAAHDPTIGVWDPVGALLTPAVLCGFSAFFGALLHRGSRVIRQQEALLAAALDDQAWLDAQEAARSVHLATLRDDIAPVLSAVTRGESIAPRRAAVLSARCRDELYLADPLCREVRQAVDTARESGTQVTFRFGTAAMTGQLNAALVTVLTETSAQLVTVFPGEDSRLVVLPALGPGWQQRIAAAIGPGLTVASDAERTIIAVAPVAAHSR